MYTFNLALGQLYASSQINTFGNKSLFVNLLLFFYFIILVLFSLFCADSAAPVGWNLCGVSWHRVQSEEQVPGDRPVHQEVEETSGRAGPPVTL